LSTAGLLLVQGAQFLAVATIVVYAGAILVTFLFVLMLAVPEGRAACDRTSYEAIVSAAVGVVIIGMLALAVGRALDEKTAIPPAGAVAEARAEGVLGQQHVARFGAELFGRHLVAIEVAGTLLLAALVGAAAVAGTTRTLAANQKEPQINADKRG
jgi:NADH-quinone oxidoreductase subunit J